MSTVKRWPVLDRPARWVTIDGKRYAAREHAQDGGRRLVAWGAHYQWVDASQVADRGDDETVSPPT